MSSFSDDFNRASSASLGANWTEDSGDASIVSDLYYKALSIDFTQVTSIYTGTPCAGVDQYVLIEFVGAPTHYPFVYFRRTDAATELYGVQVIAAGGVEWYHLDSAAGGTTQIGTTQSLGSLGENALVGFTLVGTGDNTVLRVWKNPTGTAPDAGGETWGSAAPGVSFTDNPGANAVDTGTYVGIGGQQSIVDDPGIVINTFYGGDVPAGGASNTPSATDDVTLTETATVAYGHFSVPTVVDSVTTTETVVAVLTRIPTATDAVTVTEAAVVVSTIIPSASDAVTLSESSAIQLSATETLTKFVIDSITVTDTPSVLIPLMKAVADDSVTLTDTPTLSIRGTLYPAVNEAVTVTETATPFVYPGWVADGDVVSLTETVTVRMLLLPSVAEAVTITESVAYLVTPTLAIPIVVSDAVTLTEDETEFFQNWVPVAVDTVTVTEAQSVQVLAVGTLLPVAADEITLTEAETVLLMALVPSVSDAVELSEESALETVRMLEIQATEAVTLTDAPSGFLTPLWTAIVEAVTVGEVFDYTVAGARIISVADAVVVTESPVFSDVGMGSMAFLRRRRRS